MIEVYFKGKIKDKIIWWVDGKKYLRRNKKLCGYLNRKVAKDKFGCPPLYLKDDSKKTLNEDWEYGEQGYLKEDKIYYYDMDEFIFTLKHPYLILI